MVSIGSSVVSPVVGSGKLVVVVTTLGLEVTADVSMLVVVAGMDLVVSLMTTVEAIVGRVVTTSVGLVVVRV